MMNARTMRLAVIAAFAAIATLIAIVLFQEEGGVREEHSTTSLESESIEDTEEKGALRDALSIPRFGVSETNPSTVETSSAPPAETEWSAYRLEDWETIGSLDRFPIPDEVFDEVYPSDLSRDELKEVMLSKLEEFTVASHQLAAERREMGIVEMIPAPPKDSEGAYPKNWAGQDIDWPAHSVFLNGNVPEGMLEVVWLPYADYPALYDKKDEYLYLSKRINALGKSESNLTSIFKEGPK